MKNWLNEFKEFINRGNLVELAVAFRVAPFFVPISAMVNFVIVAFVCFLTVKTYSKFQKEAEAGSRPREIDLLTQIRDELRSRNA